MIQGFVEVEIGATLDWTQFIANSIQDKWVKCGVKHHAMSTTHADMGDTLQIMVT